MRPQAYQTPEIRDENDSIIQQGTFGKKTPFVNSQNDGILDYIINNLEAIKGVSLAATVVVSSLPSAGQAGKFYLLDDGTENSGKVYVYKDKWVEVTTQAVGLSAYQIALKNGYEGTEQEWLENEVYGDNIVSAETDSDGYFIVHTRQGKTIKTTLKPLVDAKASADKAKISETNAKTSETNSANSAAAALASQKASADSQAKAKNSETNAKASENNSKSSENLAKAWAMSENSPDGVDGNKSSKMWAGEAKASASNSASSASDASTSATSAKQSETNAANSAKAAKQSEENAKTWDPTQYAKIDQTLITTADAFSIDNKDYVDINDVRLLKKSSLICLYNLTAQKLANLPEPNNNRAFLLFNFKNIKSTDDIAGNWLAVVQFLLYTAPPARIFYRRVSQNHSDTEPIFTNWTMMADTNITDALANKIPTKVSQLSNDSNYATKEELKTECVDKINKLNLALKNGFTTASLTVSGETSVPTPATTNKSNTIANTEFVHGVVSDLVNGAPTALDTLQELATALGNDPNFSTTILNKIGEKESKTDAQIEYEKLQNGINACLESKPSRGITPETNPQIIAIPLEKGMFPIAGYPDGFTVTDGKYPYSLVVNLQGNGGTLLSLYAQHKQKELYFRTGWPDERGWRTWVKLATTDDIDAIKPSLLTGNDALFNYLHRLGTNPTLPTTNKELTALGVFMSYYWHNIIAHQPTTYGQIINLPADSSNELAQLWIEQTSGRMYYRGGNTGTPINDVPFTRFLDEDDATKLKAKIPTKISQLTDDVGIAKISNGHLVINGSELWIE